MQPLDYYCSLSPMPPFMRSTKKKNQASQGLLLFKASSCGMVIKKVVTTEPILGYCSALCRASGASSSLPLYRKKDESDTSSKVTLQKFSRAKWITDCSFLPLPNLQVPWDTTNWCCQKAKKKVRSSLRFVPFVFCWKWNIVRQDEGHFLQLL